MLLLPHQVAMGFKLFQHLFEFGLFRRGQTLCCLLLMQPVASFQKLLVPWIRRQVDLERSCSQVVADQQVAVDRATLKFPACQLLVDIL